VSRRAWAIVALSAGFIVGYVTAAHADDGERLFSDSDDGDSHVATKIAAEQKLADHDKARRLLIAAASTDNWGCDCPPFVYGPYSSSADDPIAYFYPVVTKGPDPGSFLVAAGAGIYEFTGHFTKDTLDYDGWLDRRKVKHRKTTGELFTTKRRVFAVDHWCLRKSAEPLEAYSATLASMKKAGVTFCQ